MRVRIGAHAVSVARLYACFRVMGILGILWAVGAGLFLTLGGARKLTQPAWQHLLEVTHDVLLGVVPDDEIYRVVGGLLLLGGVLGVVGLLGTWRAVSLASATICLLWNAGLVGFLGLANVNTENGGNFLGVSAMLGVVIYGMRIFLLFGEPEPDDAVKLYARG